MMIENTDFNTSYWGRYSQEEFIERCMKDGIFKGYRDRVDLLKLAYKLIQDDTERDAEKASKV